METMMPKPSARRVLLVDDEPAIRSILSIRLEEAGFEAEQAGDGIEGLVKLRQWLPHLIISDIEMPRMSGIEFISVVRRRFPHLPVIVISGVPQSSLPPEVAPDVCFQKGALRFDELVEAVRAWVQKTPDRPNVPQVIHLPLRTRPDGAGYFQLTCTDCLRPFKLLNDPETTTVERTVLCTHCQARLPFLVESSEPS
ncbi:MAG: response regulator [Terriglobia bacterium]